MSMRKPYAAAAAALLAATVGRAQLAAGDVVPPLELADFAQTGATSFADLAGRVVVFEFFAYT
jgi:hypothetical protein